MQFTWEELESVGFEEELEGVNLSIRDGLFEFHALPLPNGRFLVEFEYSIYLNLTSLEHLKLFINALLEPIKEPIK